MTRKPYPSDLTDEQWEELAPLLPGVKPGGRNRSVDLREVINGILYVLRSGCAWRMMPHDLPPWGTVSWYFRRWRLDGSWERIHEALRSTYRMPLITSRRSTLLWRPPGLAAGSRGANSSHCSSVKSLGYGLRVMSQDYHIFTFSHTLLEI